jgi:hypothetical protein
MLLGGRSTRQAVVLNSRPVVSPRSGGVPFDRGTIDTGARTVRCGFRPVARLEKPPPPKEKQDVPRPPKESPPPRDNNNNSGNKGNNDSGKRGGRP